MNPWLAFALGNFTGPIFLFLLALAWARGGRVKWPKDTKHPEKP